ncbi:MAG: DUF1501 domain-containing protein [Cocleimonas sp.]|nr:DUF1501 domain-containing protein [Cocleimonas sp.]
MSHFTFSRRNFLKTIAAATATIALPTLSGLSSTAFAASGTADHTVINLFLRGAMDSLSAVIPYNESIYFDTRPTIAIPEAGRIDLDGQFAFHQAMSPLHDLYQQGDLAVVVAAGLGALSTTRSHFDAQRRMEVGTDQFTQTDGWLGRYLNATSGSASTFRGIGIGNVPKSLRGFDAALGLSTLSSFQIQTPKITTTTAMSKALGELYNDVEHPLLASQSTQTLSALDIAANKALGSLAKPSRYGTSKVGDALHQIAELIQADVGLEAATVNMGGWDLHSVMGTWQTGDMQNQLSNLSTALAAFYAEITRYQSNVTIIVTSEFGRRVAENDSGGTDHGKGGAMMVLGKGVNGGQVYGDWPGLDTLNKGDLPITTDHRQVLAEIVDTRLGGGGISSTVFPDYTHNGYLGIC